MLTTAGLAAAAMEVKVGEAWAKQALTGTTANRINASPTFTS